MLPIILPMFNICVFRFACFLFETLEVVFFTVELSST